MLEIKVVSNISEGHQKRETVQKESLEVLNIIISFFVESQLEPMACKFNRSDLQAHEAQKTEHLTHLVFHNYMILGMILGSVDGRTQHKDTQRQNFSFFFYLQL